MKHRGILIGMFAAVAAVGLFKAGSAAKHKYYLAKCAQIQTDSSSKPVSEALIGKCYETWIVETSRERIKRSAAQYKEAQHPAVEATTIPMPVPDEMAFEAVAAAGYTDAKLTSMTPEEDRDLLTIFKPEDEARVHALWWDRQFNPRFQFEATDKNGVRQKLEVRCHAEKYVPLNNDLPRIPIAFENDPHTMAVAKTEWCFAGPRPVNNPKP